MKVLAPRTQPEWKPPSAGAVGVEVVVIGWVVVQAAIVVVVVF